MNDDVPLQGTFPRQTDKCPIDNIRQNKCSLSRHALTARENEHEHVVAKWKLFDAIGQGSNGGKAYVRGTDPSAEAMSALSRSSTSRLIVGVLGQWQTAGAPCRPRTG